MCRVTETTGHDELCGFPPATQGALRLGTLAAAIWLRAALLPCLSSASAAASTVHLGPQKQPRSHPTQRLRLRSDDAMEAVRLPPRNHGRTSFHSPGGGGCSSGRRRSRRSALYDAACLAAHVAGQTARSGVTLRASLHTHLDRLHDLEPGEMWRQKGWIRSTPGGIQLDAVVRQLLAEGALFRYGAPEGDPLQRPRRHQLHGPLPQPCACAQTPWRLLRLGCDGVDGQARQC